MIKLADKAKKKRAVLIALTLGVDAVNLYCLLPVADDERVDVKKTMDYLKEHFMGCCN